MVLDKYAPLRSNKTRKNHEFFMPKELSKAIINRSKLANIYIKLLSREYVFACKKQKNLCNNLSKNLKYNCFTKIAFNGVLRNKQFY